MADVRRLNDLLYEAIDDGDWKYALKMLRAGAQVNHEFGHGWTPLSWAVVKQRWKICQLLLKHGADPNLGVQAQTGALDYAASRHTEAIAVAKLLVQKGLPPNRLLHAACKSGPFGTVRGLLRRGADPNLLDYHGELPLRDARTPAIVRQLFHFGADPLACNSDGTHPLHYNAISGRASIVRALLAAGVPPDLPEGNAYALSYAVRMGYDNCAQALLEAGANPNLIPSKSGQSPLALACFHAMPKLVTVLLERGADPTQAHSEVELGLKHYPERYDKYQEILALLPPS